MMCHIYYLYEDHIPFYIGKTNNLDKRLLYHRWRLNRRNIHIEELDIVDESNWRFWESYWIEQFKAWGFKLENKNNGGGGPTKQKPEAIENSRIKRQGQIRPSASIKLKGIERSESTRKKIGLGNSKPKPEGFGEHISRVNKGRIHSSESNTKRRNKHLGVPKPGVSLLHKGRKSPNKGVIGKKRSIQFSKNLGERRSIPVIQYDLEGNLIKEWDSMSQAGLFLGKNISLISQCCSNKIKTAYKFIWKLKE